MKPKFITQLTTTGERYFYLNAANNEVILTSETYNSKSKVINAILQIMILVSTGHCIFQTKRNENGKVYFVIKGFNNQTIATSELYENEEELTKGFYLFIDIVPAAHIIDRT